MLNKRDAWKYLASRWESQSSIVIYKLQCWTLTTAVKDMAVVKLISSETANAMLEEIPAWDWATMSAQMKVAYCLIKASELEYQTKNRHQ